MTEFSLTVLEGVSVRRWTEREERGRSVHVEGLVPVGIEGLLHDTGRVCLLCIDCDDGEGIREAEDLALGEAIGSDDCVG